MTLNEIAYSIATKLGKPIDYLLVNDLKFSVINYRSLFIRQDYTKYASFNEVFTQDLGAIPIVSVDSAECEDVLSGCKVYKTDRTLPNPIRLKNNADFTFVGAIDKITSYTKILPQEVPLLEFNKYSTDRRYYYMNDYIYVTDKVKYINVRGVFDDPREAARFNTCTGADCYTDDNEFPISGDMIAGIVTGIINGELRILQNRTEGNEVKADA